MRSNGSIARRPKVASLFVAMVFLHTSGLAVGNGHAAHAVIPQVTTVHLSPGARPVVLDAATGHVFDADWLAGTVEMRSAATGVLLARIHLAGSQSWDGMQLQLAPQQHRLLVAIPVCGRAGCAQIVDARTGRLLHTVTLGKYPQLLAFDPAAGTEIVGVDAAEHCQQPDEALHGTIALVDAASGRVLHRFSLPGELGTAAFDARRHKAVVVVQGEACQDSVPYSTDFTYDLVDTRSHTMVAVADRNGSDSPPILDPQRGIAMIVDSNDHGTVHVVDLSTGAVRHVIPVDAFPWNGVIDPNTGRAYVVSQGEAVGGQALNSTISALDLEDGRVLYRKLVGPNATGVSLSPAGDRAYVSTGIAEDDLAVVDTATGRLIGTTNVGAIWETLPALVSQGIAYALSSGDVSAQGTVDYNSGARLSELDPRSGRLLRTIALGAGASWPPLLDTAHDALLFAGAGPAVGTSLFFPFGPGTVSIVDAATGRLRQTITVGMAPSLVGEDPASGTLLVLNADGDGTAPPPARGDTSPVCSAKTAMESGGQMSVVCRQPYASLSIVAVQN